MRRLLSVPAWNAFTLWNTRHERQLPYWPLERLQEMQNRRIQEIVSYAYKNVPYYREVIDRLGISPATLSTAKDLARLPILEKDQLLDSSAQFMPFDFRPGTSLRLKSSGTAGRSKSIYHDRKALFRALAHGQRQRHVLARFVGRSAGYREMIVVRANSVQEQIREFYAANSWTPKPLDLKRQLLPMVGVSLEEQANRINRFRPNVMRGYGSYLGAFFRQAHERNIALRPPEAIVFGGDSMPEADTQLIEQKMGVPVLSTYQATEALRIGFQCEQRSGFHLSMDDVAIRVVDNQGKDVEPGGRGHLLISNLTNRATVLLNYRLGDIVTLGETSCSCGRSLPTIERIDGRSDDLITLPGGEPLHALAVLEKLQGVASVVQIQVVQEALGRFLIRATGTSISDRERAEAELVANLRSAVGHAEVSVEWVTDMPRNSGGKVKAVISKFAA